MATYKPLQSIALTAATSSVTFSGISEDYTDLVIVANGTASASAYTKLYFNGVTTNTYSATNLYGSGSAIGSARQVTGDNKGYIQCYYHYANITPAMIKINIFNYANSSIFKTVLLPDYDAASEITAKVALWSSTAPITSVTLERVSGNWNVGATFSLYGIKSGAPQALGGDVVITDGNYWYHAFKTTGALTFTAQKSLSVDYLVIAGGGAGGNNASGGGGAGGLLYNSTTIQPNQIYTVTVGAGAANSTNYSSSGTNGSNSSLIGTGVSVTATGGGAGQGPNATPAGNGGSGGGSAGYSGTPARGTGISGQGNNGGLNAAAAESSGGGGAGGVGGNGGNNSARTGVGGVGLYYDAFGSATGTGQYTNSHYYYAGGGGGGAGQTSNQATAGGFGGGGNGAGSDQNPVATAGTANTGGGGGGTAYGNTSGSSNTAGGSGIVIVRYPV
jgi:hypothetical protein